MPKPKTTARQASATTTCSPLILEALERCATIDEGFAHGYRYDAGQCLVSDVPAIRDRAQALIDRAVGFEHRAKSYRDLIAENANSPEFVLLLREVVGCIDAFRILQRLPRQSTCEQKVWETCADQLQESVENASPKWDAILKAAFEKENSGIMTHG
jgi:hypothetical protein